MPSPHAKKAASTRCLATHDYNQPLSGRKYLFFCRRGKTPAWVPVARGRAGERGGNDCFCLGFLAKKRGFMRV